MKIKGYTLVAAMAIVAAGARPPLPPGMRPAVVRSPKDAANQAVKPLAVAPQLFVNSNGLGIVNTNGQLRAGMIAGIQGSTNLSSWKVIFECPLTNGLIVFTSLATNVPAMFFRAYDR